MVKLPERLYDDTGELEEQVLMAVPMCTSN
jgi:hypothetical protein